VVEDWALRAMQRWPGVPALFGWLGLDRRGRWLIRGEVISRPQIIDTINRNYAADEHGRWYFQNGPQRGYLRLDYAPFVLRAHDAALRTHTELAVERIEQAFIDEEGSLLLLTEHGPGLLSDGDLGWASQHIEAESGPMGEEQLAAALALPSGSATGLSLRCGGARAPLRRLDVAQAPARLGFVRDPQPREGERHST
jgi:hypothetical protein